MGNEVVRDFFSVLLAIVTLATIAVILSKRANTVPVINSSSSAFNTALATAEGPVTGYNPGQPIYASQLGNMFDLAVAEPGSAGYFGGGYN
jgi:hypothetical protein